MRVDLVGVSTVQSRNARGGSLSLETAPRVVPDPPHAPRTGCCEVAPIVEKLEIHALMGSNEEREGGGGWIKGWV